MPLSKSLVYLRWGILGALCMPLLIVLLSLTGYEIKLWGCPLKALVGIPCPTWGMTRAVFAIANQQWTAAIRYNLLAPVVIILWAVAIGQISLELYLKRAFDSWWRQRNLWYGGLMFVAIYHGYRLHWLWASGTLTTDIQQSFMGNLL
ncbi:MAG: DUF2752 domain-containing protein [Cyanobacteria bacterium P01_H01_bin.21]